MNQNKPHMISYGDESVISDNSHANNELLSYEVSADDNRVQRVKHARSFVQDGAGIDNKEQLGKNAVPFESLTDVHRNNVSSATQSTSNDMISNSNISLPKMEPSDAMNKDSVIN